MGWLQPLVTGINRLKRTVALIRLQRWIAPRLTQFERWFITGLAHFYINNIAS